jgi:hypothetical protein
MADEYKDIELKIPTLENNRITKHIINALFYNVDQISNIYTVIKMLKEFENKYTYQYIEDTKKYWIKELKGITFDTKEEAQLYAFLKYCPEIDNYMKSV